jgi:hypothetical protein
MCCVKKISAKNQSKKITLFSMWRNGQLSRNLLASSLFNSFPPRAYFLPNGKENARIALPMKTRPRKKAKATTLILFV